MQGRARALLTILILASASAVQAQNFGRIVLFFKNAEEEPISGVKVVATNPDMPNFRQEKTSNKKGKVILTFSDATKSYKIMLEYKDFPAQEIVMKPELRSTLSREIVLGDQGGEMQQSGDGASTVTYSLSERIFNDGVMAMKAGDTATAKTKFLEALGQNPSMTMAHSALAGIYLEEKDFANAITSAKVVVAAEPDKPRGYYILYDAYQATGEEDEAKKIFELLKGMDSGNTAAMVFNDGVSAYEVGDYKRARTRFEEALQQQPDLKPAISALARIYLLDKSYTQAAEMAEKMLADDAQNKAALQIRYDAYRAMGDQTKAAEAFEALSSSDPKALAVALYSEASALFEKGETAAAVDRFEQVVKLDPERAKAFYQLGLCYVNLDDKGKAKESLQRFLELAPNDPDAAAAKGMLEYL